MAHSFSQRHNTCRKFSKRFLFLVLVILGIALQGCATAGIPVTDRYTEVRDLSSFAGVLEGQRNGILANRNGEAIRTQIVTMQFTEGNRVYFCTNSSKAMYRQLRRSPAVSYCTYAEDYEPVVSVNGTVVFTEDAELKKKLFNENPRLQRFYQTPDNPEFTVFYIDAEEVETFDSDGVKLYKIQ
ncbi:pyridoxamine 5'-phosphate oxidase family protein [Breznakiella homolactica]|uniref:Pyridoxamine 5'-phosphate oxidase family protein n=1 Tax=Breznakiella homolactica TaxID=2798577 RepID=A0A7T7XMS0_9SPIR|nr:pyridoxamine 5'-phosphate oxidase family protein [Breznakiella homolactica]QQO09161.1 pyridoxamine 5'-phosphate oxidase family protein [Breznakiella homolactica]